LVGHGRVAHAVVEVSEPIVVVPVVAPRRAELFSGLSDLRLCTFMAIS
jgi:hypothetical protein